LEEKIMSILRRAKAWVAVLAIAGVFGLSWLSSSETMASDHFEAPKVQANKAADITDLYIFPGADAGTTVMVVCFAGFTLGELGGDPAGATYDKNVLYELNVDSDGDNKANIRIAWRYGQNGAGDWGVQVMNVPGAPVGDAGTPNPVVGAVGSTMTAGYAKMWTGAADDPFFFDAAGYLLTLGTGNLSFDNSRDFLAGLNVTAMVIEVRTQDMQDGDKPLQIWATTGVYEG
jgi:hypothetical protein